MLSTTANGLDGLKRQSERARKRVEMMPTNHKEE